MKNSTMKISIQTNGFKIKPRLDAFVNETVEKIARFWGEIIAAEVSLRLVNSNTTESKLCEIRLAIPGNDLLASAQCKTFEEAISKAVDIIKGKIRRKKTKLIGTRNDM